MSEADAERRLERVRLGDSLATMAEHLRRITARVETRGQRIGSATIWRPDGWIVTNAHVAHHPVSLVLDDGRRFDTRVVGRCLEWDLAAIKIDADGLARARVGDSDALAVGEVVLAAGYPLGLSSAVTAGIVHAIGPREGSAAGGWIQADLRLAPGNSGGPVANARGEVIGINTMIAGGLALAIPSRRVQRFLRSLADHGVSRGSSSCPDEQR